MVKLRFIEILKGVLVMWYKISDEKDEVVFFSNCTNKQAKALLVKKIDSCKRELKLEKLSSKPEGIIVYGCSRVHVSQENVFVEVFVFNHKKWTKDQP